MILQQLVKELTFLERSPWDPSIEITDIVSDSRRVKPGNVFVACSGPATDGHRFFEEAFQKGSRVWVGERFPEKAMALSGDIVFLKVADSHEALAKFLNEFYGYPTKKLRVVAVTGTNGKTTIASSLSHLLGLRLPAGYIGTLGYQTPSRQGSLSNTTPGTEELFSLMNQMTHEGVQALTLEVSSHSLIQRRVEGLEFELALFTQLTPEHLDYHKTLENYFQAKRLLFCREPRPKKMLINRDSPYGRRLLAENRTAKSFSLWEEADYQASEIKTTFEGSEFIFQWKDQKMKVHTQLPFTHNVSNLTSVLASLDLLGFNPEEFKEALEDFPGVPGRLECIEGHGFKVFIDYAHTPDAFENILSETRRLQPKRILTLFGCGGDRDPFKRPEMTRIAYHYSDRMILTSDNPRTEDPQEILRQMRQGLPSNHLLPQVLEIPDRREAIGELLAMAEPGDVLLILGKGHEDYQILGNQKIHFDDREVVGDLLKRRSRVVI